MNRSGFTIIELLIAIVIIAALAVLSYTAYNGVRERAQTTKMKSDLALIHKAVKAAYVATSKTPLEITGDTYHSGGTGGPAAACINKVPTGTDLASLDKNNDCWRAYNDFLDKIGAASGVQI